jgi:hypothetical protein
MLFVTATLTLTFKKCIKIWVKLGDYVHSTECHFAEHHQSAECHSAEHILPRVNLLRVILLSTSVIRVIMLSVCLLRVILLSVILRSVIC